MVTAIIEELSSNVWHQKVRVAFKVVLIYLWPKKGHGDIKDCFDLVNDPLSLRFF